MALDSKRTPEQKKKRMDLYDSFYDGKKEGKVPTPKQRKILGERLYNVLAERDYMKLRERRSLPAVGPVAKIAAQPAKKQATKAKKPVRRGMMQTYN